MREKSAFIWEDLGVGNLKILQEKNSYRFTSDAVILANFVDAKTSDVVVEFCFGSGVISTLVAYKEKPKHIYGFEMQKSAYEKAQKSLKINQLESKITLFNDKNQHWKQYLSKESADIVVCNPPYQKKGDGHISQNKEIAISKTELETTLEEIVKDSYFLLKKNGTLYVCMAPERMPELLELLVKNKFGVESLFFSYASKTSKASCVFVKVIKDKKQKTYVLPPLITHNDKGDYVTTVRNLFK